jgi:hypothetical protein
LRGVVAKYNLQSNKHVKGLYDVRNYWALAYLRDYFFGGMTTTGRSEGINEFIKRFINSHTSLTDFAKQVWCITIFQSHIIILHF